MSFDKSNKVIACDNKGCTSTTNIFSNGFGEWNGWTFIFTKYDICPNCRKRLQDESGSNWKDYLVFKEQY